MHKRQPKKRHAGNEDSINYYKRVSDTLKEGFRTNEEKDLFLDNVFKQLETEAIDICQALVTSHIVEELIIEANPSHIRSLIEALKPEWPSLCCHRFGSHVVQTLTGVLPRIFSNDENEDAIKRSLEETFQEQCGSLLSDLDKFISDVYGSHVLRNVLNVLGGATVEEQVLRSRTSRVQKKEKPQCIDYEAPSEFKRLFKKFARMIFQMPDFEAHLLNEISNPVVQTVILIQKKIYPKKCLKYIRKIIKATNLFTTEESEEETAGFPKIVQHGIGSFLIEQILAISEPQLLQEIDENLFKGRLLQFAIHPMANFVLQRYIEKITNREQFEELFDELGNHTEDMLAMNCLGVVSKILQGCLRFSCKQDDMLKYLMEAFHCVTPIERQSKIVPLIGSLTTYEVFYQIKEKDESTQTDDGARELPDKIPLITEINYHGAVILQHLLKCEHPKLVVTSLLELKQVELKTLSCDPCGSHVIDVFFNSHSVGEKSKDALVNKYQGLLVDVACTKNGSRTVETMWKSLKTKQKIIVAEDLAKQEEKLRSDKFGHFVYYNFGIGHFKHRRKDWMESQGASQRKRKLFEDILTDSKGGKFQKKKGRLHSRITEETSTPGLHEAQESTVDSLSTGDPTVTAHNPQREQEHGHDKAGNKQFHKKKTFKDIKPKPRGRTFNDTKSSKTFKIQDKKHKELLELMRPIRKPKT
ncbi:hypothetical protein ScPMuIL_000038 [Solemya velum]